MVRRIIGTEKRLIFDLGLSAAGSNLQHRFESKLRAVHRYFKSEIFNTPKGLSHGHH